MSNLLPIVGPVLLVCLTIAVLLGLFLWFVFWIEDKPKSLKATLWVLGFASLLSLLIFVGRTRTPYNTLVDVPIGMLTVAIFVYAAWGVATGYIWWRDRHDSNGETKLRFISLPGTELESKSSEDVGCSSDSSISSIDQQNLLKGSKTMDHETFKSIITQMQEDSLATLLEKNSGYSNADPLHNFHQAAKLKGETTLKAIGGMMAKHTVSIYDLINKASEEYVPEEVWFEKIQDHMNYLLFLWAAVEETEIEQNSFELSDNSCLHENPQDWSDVEVVTTEYKDDPNSKKPDLNSDEALKELRRKLSAPMPAADGLMDKFIYQAAKIKASPTSKKPDLNSDADLAELRRKLIFTEDEEVVTTEYKYEPKDDWVAPKNVMINKEI